MALTFKSKTEQIEVEETFNGFSLLYRFQMKDGALSGNISGEAKVDGRNVYYMSTSDGERFNSNSNQTATDDLTGVNEKMKIDLVEIHGNPVSFSSAI